jgi:plastocyanin
MNGIRDAILVLAVVVAVAHASAGESGAWILREAPPIEIVLTEYAFGPAEPVVAAGSIRLRIVNGGIRRHNLVLLVDGVERASPELWPGDVVDWEEQIERPGRYQFWCGEYRHLEKGMVGTLIVD